jgi:8-oxo-dGTP pyrophosphatase MutT (NUDIX family)
MTRFERIGGRVVFEGKLATVRIDRYRYEDGAEAEREMVLHPGAVAVVALDADAFYMVRQPREAVGEEGLLELPAGKLDPGEDPLTTGKRELAEEIGRGARSWRHLTSFYTSPGFTDEECHVYLAQDLYEEQADSGEDERIEIERIPLADLEDTIRACRDSKSLVGLLWLHAALA